MSNPDWITIEINKGDSGYHLIIEGVGSYYLSELEQVLHRIDKELTEYYAVQNKRP